MLRLLSCVLLLSSTFGQVPYGPTAVPHGVPPSNPISTLPPNIAPTPIGQRPIAPGYNPFNTGYNGATVPILTYSNEQTGNGTYSYSFSTADGKQAQESGYLKDAYIDNAGEPQGTQVVQGSYSYVSPDGTPIQVSYIADENGFRPSGVHIPTDGKAGAPLPLDNQRVFDRFNRNQYDPYNRNHIFGQYNRPHDARYPYDPRYPYDSRSPHDSRYPYDSTRPVPYNSRYPIDARSNPFNPYQPTSYGYKKNINRESENYIA